MKLPPQHRSLAQSLARAALVAIALLCGAASTARAQMPAAELPPYGDLIYAEAAQVPGEAGQQCRVDAFVRIAHDYVVFRRAPVGGGDSTFAGSIDVSFDVLDAEGQTVATANARRDVRVRGYLATESRDGCVLVHQTFRLPEGTYKVRLHVSDGQSTRERLVVLPVRLRSLHPGKLVLASFLPLSDSVLRSTPDYRLFASGAGVPFGRPSLLALTCAVRDDARWRYIITRNDAPRAGRVVAASDIAHRAILDNVATFPVLQDADAFVLGRDSVEGRLALLRLPFDTLEAGSYRLTLFASQAGAGDAREEDSAVFDFRVFWKDMPLSLRDPDFAVSVMRYILTEEEIADLNKGSDAELLDKLSAYWRAHDPTPGTIRNERMEEYFRRADQAYFAYRTLASANGALTDRGKVFILFGPPDSVQRILKSGEAPEEIWHYPTLKRVFTFTDRERNGKYRLRS
jgi:GWxTD domain-containing protein